MKLKIYTDGSIIGGAYQSKKKAPTLPHIYGGWIVKNHLNIPIKWFCWDMGEKEGYTVNVAEYGAVRSALNWVHQNFPLASLDCYSDSQVITYQLTGKYSCLNPTLLMWRDEVLRLAGTFPSCTFNWHPRETPEAREADLMSKDMQPKYGNPISNWQDLVVKLNAKGTNKQL